MLGDGTREPYDMLLSTMPIDLLVQAMSGDVPDDVRAQASRLRHSGSYIVGVGVDAADAVEEVLDVFPRGQRAVLPRHVPLELLARSRARRDARTIRCSPRSRTRISSRSTATPSSRRPSQGMVNTRLLSERRPQGHRRHASDRARLHLSDAVARARRRARGAASLARVAATSTRAAGSARGATRSATWTTRSRRASNG